MKFGITTKLVALGTTKREYQKKDGSGKGVVYNMAVFQDGVAGNVDITEDLYNLVISDPSKPQIFGGTYDDKYGRFVLDAVYPEGGVSPAPKK